MKTNFLSGIMITALIATSCSKDEVSSIYNQDDNIIGFELSTGKTRAEVSDVKAITSSSNGIGIFATNGLSENTFIDNVAYKYIDKTWKWDGSDIMWPEKEEEYPINFYAYFPNDLMLNDELNADYTIKQTPIEQIDYLAANSIGVERKPTLGYVPLPFKHILSKIDFRIVTGADVTVEVQSIAVRNVGETGTFNYAKLGWIAEPTDYISGYDYMTANDEMNVFIGQTEWKGVKGSSNSLMLMPQNLAGKEWDKQLGTHNTMSHIEVVYRVYATDGGKDIVGFTDATEHPKYKELTNPLDQVTGALFVKVGYPLPTLWEMGKSYAYTVFIADGQSSGGNLIDGNFIDEKGNTTKLEVVNPETGLPILPPDPIFPDSEVIGFTITVGTWEETQPAIDLK